MRCTSFLLLTYDVKKIPLDFPKNVLRKSGDFSLFVYIWHMPVAGIIANVFSRGHLTFLVILRPFIVLTIVFVAMQLTSFVLKKFKWKKIGVIFGLKL